jgi:hypothetical protein
MKISCKPDSKIEHQIIRRSASSPAAMKNRANAGRSLLLLTLSSPAVEN